jgi:hypothetical protein
MRWFCTERKIENDEECLEGVAHNSLKECAW